MQIAVANRLMLRLMKHGLDDEAHRLLVNYAREYLDSNPEAVGLLAEMKNGN